MTKLHQPLAATQVGVFVGLGLGRECAARSPEVNQRLHGLKLMWLEHIQRGGGQDEVAETAVELFLEVQVIERFDKVSPVQV